MELLAERREWPRTEVVRPQLALVTLVLGELGDTARVLDWSPGGILISVEGLRSSRRTADLVRLIGDQLLLVEELVPYGDRESDADEGSADGNDPATPSHNPPPGTRISPSPWLPV